MPTEDDPYIASLKAEIEDLREKMDHMVAMKRKINREVVAELGEVRVNPDECYFPPVTLARRVVKAEAEADQLRLRDRDLCDALSFMTVAIDPAQSDDTDDWELTDVRWRKRVDEMHAELQRLQAIIDPLEKTADGVPVIPHKTKVYHPDEIGHDGPAAMYITSSNFAWVHRGAGTATPHYETRTCYSTPSAALAANHSRSDDAPNTDD